MWKSSEPEPMADADRQNWSSSDETELLLGRVTDANSNYSILKLGEQTDLFLESWKAKIAGSSLQLLKSHHSNSQLHAGMLPLHSAVSPQILPFQIYAAIMAGQNTKSQTSLAPHAYDGDSLW